MREIKFRAWDKRLELLSADFSIWDDNILFGDKYIPIFKTDIELMQYTGLKDKNGVEIYEGDIVSYDNDILEIKWISQQVGINGWEYGTGYTGFIADNIKYKYDDNEISGIAQSGGHGNHGDTNLYTDDFEVIGSIYQNGDLLNA